MAAMAGRFINGSAVLPSDTEEPEADVGGDGPGKVCVNIVPVFTSEVVMMFGYWEIKVVVSFFAIGGTLLAKTRYMFTNSKIS